MASGRRSVNVDVIKPRCRDEGTRSKAMSRYERRIYFEWLVEMRAAYATLDDEDRTPVISVADVIAWAELELAAAVRRRPHADQRRVTGRPLSRRVAAL